MDIDITTHSTPDDLFFNDFIKRLRAIHKLEMAENAPPLPVDDDFNRTAAGCANRFHTPTVRVDFPSIPIANIKDSLVTLSQQERQELYRLLHDAFGCRM